MAFPRIRPLALGFHDFPDASTFGAAEARRTGGANTTFPRTLSELRSERRLGGGSGGGAEQQISEQGTRFAVKADGTGEGGNPPPAGHMAEEVLTDSVLHAAGTPVAASRLIEGKKVSVLFENSQPAADFLNNPSYRAQVLDAVATDYPAQALVGNWDAFTQPDNFRMRLAPNGALERAAVDTGGGLGRRSRGNLKGSDFRTVPMELWTLRENRRSMARAFLSGLTWSTLVDKMGPVLAKRKAILEAASVNPERQAVLRQRLDAMQCIYDVSRALLQNGMPDTQVDTFVRGLMDDVLRGGALPYVDDAVARAGYR